MTKPDQLHESRASQDLRNELDRLAGRVLAIEQTVSAMLVLSIVDQHPDNAMSNLLELGAELRNHIRYLEDDTVRRTVRRHAELTVDRIIFDAADCIVGAETWH